VAKEKCKPSPIFRCRIIWGMQTASFGDPSHAPP
jgi:hypothetical protein